MHPRTLKATVFSPRPHKVEITGGIVVGKVPAKLGNTSLVVVSMLRVKLYIAVTVQKHQLHREEWKKQTNKKAEWALNYQNLKMLKKQHFKTKGPPAPWSSRQTGCQRPRLSEEEKRIMKFSHCPVNKAEQSRSLKTYHLNLDSAQTSGTAGRCHSSESLVCKCLEQKKWFDPVGIPGLRQYYFKMTLSDSSAVWTWVM